MYSLFFENSFTTTSHLSLTITFVWIIMIVKSSNFCISNNFADHSFLSHWAFAAVLSVVGFAASANTGVGINLSKCPQKPLASTASWNLKMKIVQFVPEVSSLGTDDGRASESAAIVIV